MLKLKLINVINYKASSELIRLRRSTGINSKARVLNVLADSTTAN